MPFVPERADLVYPCGCEIGEFLCPVAGEALGRSEPRVLASPARSVGS